MQQTPSQLTPQKLATGKKVAVAKKKQTPVINTPQHVLNIPKCTKSEVPSYGSVHDNSYGAASQFTASQSTNFLPLQFQNFQNA